MFTSKSNKKEICKTLLLTLCLVDESGKTNQKQLQTADKTNNKVKDDKMLHKAEGNYTWVKAICGFITRTVPFYFKNKFEPILSGNYNQSHSRDFNIIIITT